MHAMSRFLSFCKIKIIKIGVCVKSCIHSQNVFAFKYAANIHVFLQSTKFHHEIFRLFS